MSFKVLHILKLSVGKFLNIALVSFEKTEHKTNPNISVEIVHFK